jgi:hypothetical protein
MLRHCTALCLVLLCYGGLAQTATALDMDIRTSPANRLDFAVWLSNNKTTLSDHTVSTRIKYQRIGVAAFDVPARGAQLGMQLGYASTSQDDVSAARGMDLNGYYLGLGLRVPLLEATRFKARFEAGYIYQDVKDSTESQKVSLDWHEYNAGLLASVPLQRVELQAGLFYQRFDATQTASGTIQQTLFLKNEDTLQQRLGINYRVAPDEHVGLHFHSGASQGVQLEFQKLF